MSIPIGTDARFSIADQDGHFVVLGPEPQRSEIEKFLAEHPEIEQQAIAEERSQRMGVLVTGSARGWDLAGNAGDRSSAVWMRGDRIIIDDPWAAGEPLDLEASRGIFERAAALSGTDAVVIMARAHGMGEDMHALDNARYPGKLIEREPLKLSAPARPDPRNRAERRAQEARQRKAGR